MIGMFDVFFRSGWEIQVWDCEGTVRPENSEIFEQMEKDPEVNWVKAGNFVFPLHKSIKVNKRLLSKLEGWGHMVLRNRGGAINWSGVYFVTVFEFEELLKIIVKYSDVEDVSAKQQKISHAMKQLFK